MTMTNAIGVWCACVTPGELFLVKPGRDLKISNLSLGSDLKEGRSSFHIHFKTVEWDVGIDNNNSKPNIPNLSKAIICVLSSGLNEHAMVDIVLEQGQDYVLEVSGTKYGTLFEGIFAFLSQRNKLRFRSIETSRLLFNNLPVPREKVELATINFANKETFQGFKAPELKATSEDQRTRKERPAPRKRKALESSRVSLTGGHAAASASHTTTGTHTAVSQKIQAPHEYPTTSPSPLKKTKHLPNEATNEMSLSGPTSSITTSTPAWLVGVGPQPSIVPEPTPETGSHKPMNDVKVSTIDPPNSKLRGKISQSLARTSKAPSKSSDVPTKALTTSSEAALLKSRKKSHKAPTKALVTTTETEVLQVRPDLPSIPPSQAIPPTPLPKSKKKVNTVQPPVTVEAARASIDETLLSLAKEVTVTDVEIGQGPRIQNNHTIIMWYLCKIIETNYIYQSTTTADGSPASFVLGQGSFPDAIEYGMRGMHVGGTRVITIPSALGEIDSNWKDHLTAMKIPDNSTVHFQCKVLGCAPMTEEL